MSGPLTAQVEMPLRGFDLDLELNASGGQPLALVGLSGAGKTSLLRVVAGLMAPRTGRVELDGQVWLDTERGVDLPAEQRGCGFLFQDYALFPRMSAWRNVAYGTGEPRRRRRAAAIAMLDRFGVGALADARPPSLSGGERQRVALARALAARPRALLLDEPLSALDSSTRRKALAELRRVLVELEVPAILVTHSFDEAALLASALTVVDRGQIVQSGTATEISTSPASPFVADFAGAVVLRGEATGADGDLTLVRLEGGGEVHSIDHARGPVAISVFPWEISLEPSARAADDSMLNRVEGEVTSMTMLGNRARIGISVPQSLSADITARSAAALGLRPGQRVTAAWKASATRLVPLGESPSHR
ncbi:MAG TPA: ABC transporter ATP-binding protein [Solirubrobacterales bacterium]|nr:ABC transporter ATP-binding protein [Solirubrobacterales bacterium]